MESAIGFTPYLQLVPVADRVAQHLEIISKTFDLVPGVPGFS